MIKEWKYRYRYSVRHSVNKTSTGVIQVGRKMSGNDVLNLIKEMKKHISNDAKLLEYSLVETNA